eukprot:4962369-Amphidinium_carterae.1
MCAVQSSPPQPVKYPHDVPGLLESCLLAAPCCQSLLAHPFLEAVEDPHKADIQAVLAIETKDLKLRIARLATRLSRLKDCMHGNAKPRRCLSI